MRVLVACEFSATVRDAFIARRDRLLKDPKRAAKRAAAAEARERAEAKKQELLAEHRRLAALEGAERVAQWRAGGEVRLHWGDVNRADSGDLLRVTGDKVQTSAGAECPLDDAVRALRFWRRIVDAGQSLADTGIRLGNFRLDRIEANGDVRAGCHNIKRAEIENLERLIAAREVTP